MIYPASLNTVTIATSSVTSSIFGCTITETFEIRNESDGTWVELTDPSTYAWVQAFTNGASIDVGTTDYATYATQVFNARAKFLDPGSAQTSATVYDPFTVTFTFACSTDVLSINAIADQTFTLGDSALTTAVTTGQTEASCASFTTLVYEAYDDASGTWVLASTQNWY